MRACKASMRQTPKAPSEPAVGLVHERSPLLPSRFPISSLIWLLALVTLRLEVLRFELRIFFHPLVHFVRRGDGICQQKNRQSTHLVG